MTQTTDHMGPLGDVEQQVRKRGKPGTREQRERSRARRAQALSYRLAGLTYEQIGERLEVSTNRAGQLVDRALERAENQSVDQMRKLENERLDRAQAAIWPRVLRGDDKAISIYLQISDRRARMNGMNAPTQIDLSMSVKHEMEQALGDLENMVMGQSEQITDGSGEQPREEDVVDAELVEDD